MKENPSPSLPPTRTSFVQVLPSSAGNKILHTSTQQQENEMESDAHANAVYTNCNKVYYSSILEAADSSYFTSLSVDRTFLQIVANRMRQVRSAMLKLKYL